MADWSQLLPELLTQISKRVDLLEDFLAFRGVCTSWRAAASEANFNKTWPGPPWIMLAENKEGDDREFYSLAKGRICRRLFLPEARGKKCMESRGWFIALGVSGEMSLLHPFSRAQIELPHITTFPRYEECQPMDPLIFIEKAVLSASPSETSDYVVMVVHGGGRYLGYWRPGDVSWIGIESRRGAFSDVNYHNGKFYAISYGGHVWVWDVSAPDHHPTVAKNPFSIDPKFKDGTSISRCRLYLLAESSPSAAGNVQLFIVARDGIYVRDDGEYGAKKFRVIQLDLTNGRGEEISSLGDRSIFVGHNAAFSVDATTSFPGVIRPNCIYFTDDSIDAYREAYEDTGIGGGRDMGIYDLGDSKFERFGGVQSFSHIGPPVWIFPSL